jgi:hypothetical protein
MTKTEFHNNLMKTHGSYVDGIYVPAGTICDLVMISCAKHKKCKCPVTYRVQGIVRKEKHQRGKMFALDCVPYVQPDTGLSLEDLIGGTGFENAFVHADQPTTFDYWYPDFQNTPKYYFGR